MYFKKLTIKSKKIISLLFGTQSRQSQEVIGIISPKVRGSGLKIHLGPGPINILGWINIDARDDVHIHLKSNGFDLKEFSDGVINEIYMCHVLEHFSFEEAKTILKNMNNKLSVNGVLRLSVPDFDQLLTIYVANKNQLDLIKKALMGGQDYDYNFHKSIYNKKLLTQLLFDCGFVDVQNWNTEEDFGTDLGDWSNKSFETVAGNFQVSLNLKAKKV